MTSRQFAETVRNVARSAKQFGSKHNSRPSTQNILYVKDAQVHREQTGRRIACESGLGAALQLAPRVANIFVRLPFCPVCSSDWAAHIDARNRSLLQERS